MSACWMWSGNYLMSNKREVVIIALLGILIDRGPLEYIMNVYFA